MTRIKFPPVRFARGIFSLKRNMLPIAVVLLCMASSGIYFFRFYNNHQLVDGIPAVATKNEEQYDAKYWEWQKTMNMFGAAYKGDIIKHLFLTLPEKKAQSILEFGCSGGYILNTMPVPHKYCVEINPSARAFARDTFPDIQDIFSRLEDIPEGLRFDIIYTTSVLEHVDCPLCELRKLKYKLTPGGMLIVGLRNDGADHLSQTFDKIKNDPNHHIYTWNPLLLGNLLTSAGYTPCNVIGQFDAWHSIKVEKYKQDKHAYCLEGLKVGKQNNVHNLWSLSVAEPGACQDYKKQVNQILNCDYLNPRKLS